jgi:hypothetical protein
VLPHLSIAGILLLLADSSWRGPVRAVAIQHLLKVMLASASIAVFNHVILIETRMAFNSN